MRPCAVFVLHQSNAVAWEYLVAGGLAAIFLLVGIGFGLVALFGGRRHGARGLAGLSAASIVLGLVLLRLADRRYQAAASPQTNGPAAETAEEPAPAPAPLPTHQANSVSSSSQSPTDSVEEEKRLALATASYASKVQAVTAEYDHSLQAMQQATILNYETLRARVQLQTRRQAVQAFLTANENWREVVASAEEFYRLELAHFKVSPLLAERALVEFQKSVGEQTPYLLQMRSADAQWGNAILGMLGMLGSNWGQWTYDTAEGSVSFEDDEVTSRYEALIEAMETAEDERAAARQALEGR
jgi:hypothetical protein